MFGLGGVSPMPMDGARLSHPNELDDVSQSHDNNLIPNRRDTRDTARHIPSLRSQAAIPMYMYTRVCTLKHRAATRNTHVHVHTSMYTQTHLDVDVVGAPQPLPEPRVRVRVRVGCERRYFSMLQKPSRA